MRGPYDRHMAHVPSTSEQTFFPQGFNGARDKGARHNRAQYRIETRVE